MENGRKKNLAREGRKVGNKTLSFVKTQAATPILLIAFPPFFKTLSPNVNFPMLCMTTAS